VPALTALGESLMQCRQSKAHQYLKELAACPWCRIEERARLVLFGIPAYDMHSYDVKRAQAAFNLSTAWTPIATEKPPPPDPPLPEYRLEPTQQVRGQARARRFLGGVGSSLVPLSIFGTVTDRIDPPLIAAAFFLSMWVLRGRKEIGRKGVEERLKHAQRDYADALERWEKQATTARFTRALQDLDAKRTRYRNLHATRQARLDELGGKVRERQLQTFLDTFSIERADIDGIGSARVATLQSYGVETAADVVRATILAIPGFGPSYTERLLDWRRTVEARFRFDARRGIARADIEAVDWGIEAERIELERTLLDGPSTLRRVKAEILKARHDLWPELDRTAHLLAQATADRKALGR
jgi:DNA-binding helix-hairpin-helix protein with protein kinase domain